MSNILQILGKNIKFYREKAKLSQLKLAYQLEISPSYLVAIETGKQNPTVKILEKFATFFKIDTYMLLMPPESISKNSNDKNSTQIILRDLQEKINGLFANAISD